jgi:predicted naringenin-chalcone synthase
MKYLLSAEGALPANRVSQKNTMELTRSYNGSNPRQKKLLETIYEKVAIDHRYSVFSETLTDGQTFFDDFFKSCGPGTTERMLCFEKYAPGLASLAAAKAMKTAVISREDIGHLVSVSCTGFVAPGFDVAMIKSLSLLPSITRTNIGFMGCHGVFNALRVASALCNDQPGQDVLIASVELCSLHFRHGWNPREVLGNALFSDGAGAAVVSSRKRSPENWRIVAQGSFIIPDSEDAITWRVGDEGFEMTLSPKIRQLIKVFLGPWLKVWLTKQGFRIDEIRSWAVHPGGPGVLDSVEEGLGLPDDALKTSRKILKLFGNMSSVTVLFILEEILRRKGAKPCVSLGFGPGMTIEAALFL